jgi:hypothetical protein
MTPIRKVTVHIAGDRSIDVARNLVKEAAHLRDLVAHATEFTFRPNYGDVNDEFSDDPERRDAVVLSWRGPSSVEGGDPDRWAILHQHSWCWSRSGREFVYEPFPSARDAAFLADCRFSLDEAVGLMPGILRAIEAVRVPELKRMVEARTARVKP